jgi:hypothetical protein
MSGHRFTPTAQELAALAVVFEAAEWHSGTGLRMRRLLCSWWNASELGGFHLNDLWQFDDIRLPAALTVIAMIGRAPGGTYADAIEGYGDRMRAIATRHARELELGARFTFARWNEPRQDWQRIHGAPEHETRAEAERERYSYARKLGSKSDDLQVIAFWRDDDEGES